MLRAKLFGKVAGGYRIAARDGSEFLGKWNSMGAASHGASFASEWEPQWEWKRPW